MKAPSFRLFENRKFMWDGAVHAQEADAARAAETYRQARFDVRVVAEDGEWCVYTRRRAAAEGGGGAGDEAPASDPGATAAPGTSCCSTTGR